MNNKIQLENPLRQRLTIAMITLIVFVIVCGINLLIMRAISTKNYNGQVIELTGEVQQVILDEDESKHEIVVDDISYNANTVARFCQDLDLDTLLHQTVTLYLTQTQVGKTPWVLGIKIDDKILADYEEIIALGREDNRKLMIAFGIAACVLFAAACGVSIWRMKVSPTREYDLAQHLSKFCMARQPNCPEYKKYFWYLLICMVVIVLSTTAIGIVGDYVKNETVQIAICSSLGALVLLDVTLLLVIPTLWLYKKERKFYADNFPFDFTDVSHIRMRKKFKEQLQQELNAERATYPHRYGDGGNGYTVEFTNEGLKLYDFDLLDPYETPTTEEVFGIEDAEHNAQCLICTIDYQTLNFEALPFYRKAMFPLTIVIKSRLDKDSAPNELETDVHLVLDSNLLASLQQFNVSVENLQYILDNKKQLISQNCGKIANK